MRKRKRRIRPQAEQRRRARFWKLLWVCGMLITAVVLVDVRLRRVIETIAEHQAQVYAVRLINNAMLSELNNTQVPYSSLVQVTQTAEGEVASIQTNMLEINRLKSQITNRMLENLRESGKQSVWVPLGTLSGSQFLSGRGPDVEIKVLPRGYVHTELYNQFTSAGINQTLHQIMLRVSMQVVAIIPGYTVTTDVSTNYAIAETVIVGQIPSAFTQIDGDDSSTISKINDYGAGMNAASP